MMKALKFPFVLLLFLSVHCSAQSRKMWIEDGDKFYHQKDYPNAISHYLKALDDTTVLKTVSVLPYEVQMVNLKFKNDSAKAAKKGKEKPASDSSASAGKKGKKGSLKQADPELYALLQLGHAYRMNAEHDKAVEAYKKALDKNAPDARFFYASSLMQVRRYQEAMNEFENYVSSNPSNDSLARVAQKKEAGCYLALDSTNINRKLVVIQLDTSVFNKGNSSFAATYFSDTSRVLFTSSRKGNVIVDPKKEDAEYLCDLYLAELRDTSWAAASNIGAPINSNLHEGAAFVNERALYFTRWADKNPKEASIWKANRQSDRFFLPQKLNQNVNLTAYKSMHPFVTNDGRKLIFSSNRPGGKGGMDLWVCELDESGMPGEAKNLGSPVNTAGDEVTPFLHSTSGMLYFSSNGHAGLGGLDVFKAEYNAIDNVFGIPTNVNAPINSSRDDAYFVMEKRGLRGFVTSDRADCPGGNCYKLYKFQSAPVLFDIAGIVFDGTTNEPMPNAMVTIRNVHDDDDVLYVLSDASGAYSASLRPNVEYFMKAQKNKYLADAASHSTKDKSVSTHFEQDFFLNKIPEGEIEISGIEYDFNSATLRPASMASLDKIVDLLKLNDNLSVELEANTDSRGNDDYNMKLSQARAQSCVDYIVSKGISAARIKSKGFGETNPLITDAEIKKLKPKSPEWEAAHQKNRRTALRIVGESEIKIINKGK